MQHLPAWLQPPPIRDDEQAHKARLLYIVTGALIGLALVYVVLAPFLTNGYQGIPYTLITLSVLALTHALNRQGQTALAGWLLTLGLWVAFTIPLFGSQQGVYGAAYRAYVVPILLASLLLSERAALGIALVSCAVGALVLPISISGVPALDPDLVWVGQCMIFIGAALLVGLATRDTRHVLERLRTSETQLAQSNQQLQAEMAERETAQHALKASEARFAKAFYANPSGLAISTIEDGRYIDVNDRLPELLGYFREEMIGRTSLELGLFPDEASRLSQVVLPLQQDGRLRNVEIVLLNSAHQPLNILLSAEMIELDGQSYILSMVRDVTDERRAEQQRFALALAHERVTMMSEFLSHISHDLKTPLAIIRMSLALLQALHPQDPIEQDELRKIETQSALLDRFIQNILTISRLDYTPRFDLTPTNLHDLLTELIDNLRPSAEQRRQALTLSLDTNGATQVAAARDDLYRALANLVENAISYTPDGGSISIECRRGVIEVRDSGIGISAEALPNIFERFYRTEDARHRHKTGSGLGLAIVKRVIEMHNGTVEVVSVVGKGTTFRVRLPVV